MSNMDKDMLTISPFMLQNQAVTNEEWVSLRRVGQIGNYVLAPCKTNEMYPLSHKYINSLRRSNLPSFTGVTLYHKLHLSPANLGGSACILKIL